MQIGYSESFKNGFKATLILIFLFASLLTIVTLIPSSLLQKNIASSIQTLSEEGQYPSYGLSFRQIVLDNYTDSLMLNTAYSSDSQKPFVSAFTNPRYEGMEDSINQVSNLEKAYSHEDVSLVQYERYWHGYLVYLRPFLVFLPYTSIRLILTGFLLISIGLFVYRTKKKLGILDACIFLVGLFMIDAFYLGQSMQFISVMLIGLCGGIFLLDQEKKDIHTFISFLVIGAVTSFLDLLTAPLITLGFALLTLARLRKLTLKDVFAHSLTWSIGYLMIWASKWIIVELFISPGAIRTAIDQIINRTVHQPDPGFSHLATLRLNIAQLIGYSKTSKILVMTTALVLGIVFLKYKKITEKSIQNSLPLIFIMFIPYVWYLIAANHSYIHVWLTYRDQFMTVVAGLFLLFENIDAKKIKSDVSHFLPQLTYKNHPKRP